MHKKGRNVYKSVPSVVEELMARNAVVTGATSGIGAFYAHALAERGCDLILTGRRKPELEATADSIAKNTNRNVEIHLVSFEDERIRREFCRRIGKIPDIEYLVNNAGFGLSKAFDGIESGLHYAMIDVHIRAPVELMDAVIPGMVERKHGFIVNVSSLASFFPVPRGSTYSATKAFITSFSESVSMELGSRGIRVQALCPGMTHTDFHERMGVAGKEMKQRKYLKWMDPRDVVRQSLKCLERDRVVCVPGLFNKFTVMIGKRTPRRLYYRILKAARRETAGA